MSFRTEEKFFINSDKYVDLKNYLILKGANRQYPRRLIKSIYFDNDNLQSFIDSQEGSVVRKKIRIRNYPNTTKSKNKTLLECKISSIEGRYKTSNKLNDNFTNKFLRYGYFDSLYGLCKPVVEVLYNREYYIFQNGLRVTLDRNIEYYKYNEPLKKIKNYLIVMEVKSAGPVCSNIILNQFPFIKNRFSKFAYAVQALYKKAY